MGEKKRIRSADVSLVLSTALLTAGIVFVFSPRSTPETDTPQHDDEPLELSIPMNRIERHTAKIRCALKEDNPRLVRFHLHEMKESFEDLKGIIEHRDGTDYNIKDLAYGHLDKPLSGLERWLVDGGSPKEERYSDLIASCNACHQHTKSTYIHIKDDFDAPCDHFLQDFTL